MVRLVVIGARETDWQTIAARLRGVTLQACDEDSLTLAALQDLDGAAFFGPADKNRAWIERCLGAGKPVLLSADACTSLAMLRAFSERARLVQTPVIVANRERYVPSRQLIRQQIDAGKLGEPGLIRLHRWEPPAAQETPQDLPGALLCDLDLVAWLFGKSPTVVYAVEQSAADSHVRIGVQIHLGFPGDGMALVDHVALLPSDAGYCSLAVIGSAGAAYADDHQNMQLVFRSGVARAVRTDEGAGQWSALLQEFAEAIRTFVGRNSADDKRTGAERRPVDWDRTLAIGDAVRKSLRSRAAVAPEEL